MKEVCLKFKLPNFDKAARKWARETFEQSMDEICMFGIDGDEPLTYLFKYKGKRAGKLVIAEKMTAKEKKEKVNN